MLNTLNLTVTEQCNLKCLHCGADGNCTSECEDKRLTELTNEEYYEVLEQAKELGCSHVIIAGGEPFLRKGIWDILQYIEKLKMSVAILTNGTLLSEEIAKRLSNFKNISYVRVSLDYNNNEVMERFRGVNGMVDKVFQALETLKKYNIKTAIGMTIMPDNIQDIIPIATRAEQAGASFFRAIPMMPIGRAKGVEIDTDFYGKALREMLVLAETMQHYYFGTVFLPKDLREVAPELVTKCPGGDSSISISAYGHVSRCPLTVLDYAKQTIREVPFKDLYQNEVEKKRAEVKSILDNQEEKCGTCLSKKGCLGGCLAEMEARYGCINASQPICIKEVWKKALEEKENTRLLKRTVNNLMVLNETLKSNGTQFCLRSLPVWWISFPKDRSQLESV